MKKYVVVDTNVLLVAEGLHDKAGLDCELLCVSTLDSLRSGRVVILDSLGLILDEYKRKLRGKRYQGQGYQFIKWLYDMQGYKEHCMLVDVTPITANSVDFKEFPKGKAFKKFDPSDKKFVAAAVASKRNPAILNAADSDWHQFAEAFAKVGVQVQSICPCMKGH